METTNGQSHDSEPPVTWKRKSFRLEALAGRRPRERAEIETSRDLAKPTEQLMCDFYEEAEKADQSGGDQTALLRHTLHAQKRMVGMMAKVAKSNDRLQWWFMALTIVMAVFTVVQTVATVMSAVNGK